MNQLFVNLKRPICTGCPNVCTKILYSRPKNNSFVLMTSSRFDKLIVSIIQCSVGTTKWHVHITRFYKNLQTPTRNHILFSCFSFFIPDKKYLSLKPLNLEAFLVGSVLWYPSIGTMFEISSGYQKESFASFRIQMKKLQEFVGYQWCEYVICWKIV